MLTFNTPEELDPYLGKNIGISPWVTITQKEIHDFAYATHDTQWIHVDPERVARENLHLVAHGFGQTPYDRTIAHGYYSVALLGSLTARACNFTFVRLIVNYGSDRIRYTTPVPVNSRVRGHYKVLRWEWLRKRNGIKCFWDSKLQVEGDKKWAVIARPIMLYFFDPKDTEV